jgi:hypothetical protein
MCPVDLVESPEQVFGSAVYVVSTRVIGEVVGERRLAQLLPEQIDLVEEKDDGCSHKPSGVDDRVKKDQTFHHAVLLWSGEHVRNQAATGSHT